RQTTQSPAANPAPHAAQPAAPEAQRQFQSPAQPQYSSVPPTVADDQSHSHFGKIVSELSLGYAFLGKFAVLPRRVLSYDSLPRGMSGVGARIVFDVHTQRCPVAEASPRFARSCVLSRPRLGAPWQHRGARPWG